MEPIISTLFDLHTWIIALVVIAFLGITGTIHYALKLHELKKWDETQGSLYVNSLLKIIELKKSNKREFMKRTSLGMAAADLERDIKQLKRLNGGYILTIENMDKERIKHFNDYLAEIDRYKKLELENHDLLKRIQSLTETIEHRKHKPLKTSVPDSEYWTPVGTVQVYPQFSLGKNYKKGKAIPPHESLLFLVDDLGGEYQVHKAHFKPVHNT